MCRVRPELAVGGTCFTSQSGGCTYKIRKIYQCFVFIFQRYVFLFWAWGKSFIFCYKQVESLIWGKVMLYLWGAGVEVALIA
jgi:hypothetical protein